MQGDTGHASRPDYSDQLVQGDTRQALWDEVRRLERERRLTDVAHAEELERERKRTADLQAESQAERRGRLELHREMEEATAERRELQEEVSAMRYEVERAQANA